MGIRENRRQVVKNAYIETKAGKNSYIRPLDPNDLMKKVLREHIEAAKKEKDSE